MEDEPTKWYWEYPSCRRREGWKEGRKVGRKQEVKKRKTVFGTEVVSESRFQRRGRRYLLVEAAEIPVLPHAAQHLGRRLHHFGTMSGNSAEHKTKHRRYKAPLASESSRGSLRSEKQAEQEGT